MQKPVAIFCFSKKSWSLTGFIIVVIVITDIVAWQFNREFYCIIDHDAEVSCVGFLFAMGDQLFIRLNDEFNQKLKLLLDIFVEELNTKDSIQSDMLTMLLKRLIILITKLAKTGYLPNAKRKTTSDWILFENLIYWWREISILSTQ